MVAEDRTLVVTAITDTITFIGLPFQNLEVLIQSNQVESVAIKSSKFLAYGLLPTGIGKSNQQGFHQLPYRCVLKVASQRRVQY